MASHFPDQVKVAFTILRRPREFDALYQYGYKIKVYDGFYIQLLSEVLKFTPLLWFTSEGRGMMKSDGNWTGVMGMLQRGEADISVDSYAILPDKAKVVDFSVPHLYTDFTFMTQNPEPQRKSFAILQPFDSRIWIAIAACFFTMSVVLYIMKRRTRSYQRTLVRVFGSLLEQDLHLDFRSWHKRLIVLSWVVGVMFLNYSYKAVILSILSFPPLIGIRDIADLSRAVAAGSHVVVTGRGNTAITGLQYSSDPSLRIIGKSSSENSIVSGTVESVMAMEKPRGVLVIPRIHLTPYQNIYYVSQDSFYMTMVGVAIRKNFCCKKKLNEAARRIFEAGLYKKFIREDDLKKFLKKKISPRVENTHVLALEDLTGAFILLLAGHLLAATVFVVEYFFGKRYRRSVK